MISMRPGELPTAYIITYISPVAELLVAVIGFGVRAFTLVSEILGHRCTAFVPLVTHDTKNYGNHIRL